MVLYIDYYASMEPFNDGLYSINKSKLWASLTFGSMKYVYKYRLYNEVKVAMIFIKPRAVGLGLINAMS